MIKKALRILKIWGIVTGLVVGITSLYAGLVFVMTFVSVKYGDVVALSGLVFVLTVLITALVVTYES